MDQALIDQAKHFKESFQRTVNDDAMPPAIIVERGGKNLCTVLATKADRDLALHAAKLLREGFDPDSLTLVFDARCAASMPEEDLEKFNERLPEGGLQQAAQEGRAEELGIVECIMLHRIDREGNMSGTQITYECEDNKINWLEQTDFEGNQKGIIPDVLQDIMTKPAEFERSPQFQMVSSLFSDMDAEEKRIRLGRAMLSQLTNMGFAVLASTEIMKYGPLMGCDATPLGAENN